MEVKCLELEVSLQDDGVGEDEVERQVSALRQKLLVESLGANGTERERGSIKSYERHELGQAKALANESMCFLSFWAIGSYMNNRVVC